jgi:hypothetical protein
MDDLRHLRDAALLLEINADATIRRLGAVKRECGRRGLHREYGRRVRAILQPLTLIERPPQPPGWRDLNAPQI